MKTQIYGTIVTGELDSEKLYRVGNVYAPYDTKTKERVRYPESGVTFYYGFRSTSEAMARAFQRAAVDNLEMYGVEIELEFEQSSREGSIGLAELKQRQSLSLHSLKSDLVTVLLDIIHRELEIHNLMGNILNITNDKGRQVYALKSGELKRTSIEGIISHYPFILDAIWADSHFNHLDMITYKVVEANIGYSNRATLFRKGSIAVIDSVPAIKIIQRPDVVVDLEKDLPL